MRKLFQYLSDGFWRWVLRGFIIVGLLVMVSGCGQVPTEALWRSPEYGVAMLDAPGAEWLSPTDLDVLVNRFTVPLERSAGWKDLDVRRCVSKAKIWTEESVFTCDARNAQSAPVSTSCDGQELGDVLRVVRTDCPWDSSLRHELAHQLQECLTGVSDLNHAQQAVWSVVNRQRDPATQNCLGDEPSTTTVFPPAGDPGSASMP